MLVQSGGGVPGGVGSPLEAAVLAVVGAEVGWAGWVGPATGVSRLAKGVGDGRTAGAPGVELGALSGVVVGVGVAGMRVLPGGAARSRALQALNRSSASQNTRISFLLMGNPSTALYGQKG